MGCAARALTFIAVVLCCGRAYAYEVSTTEAGDEIKWAAGGAPYHFNAQGAPANALAAVQAALQTWTNVRASSLTFTYSGPTTEADFGSRDFVNIIGFGNIQDSSILALTTGWYVPSTGELLDTDIEFNSNVPFSTAGSPTAYDFQSTAVHELGHCLSLADLYEPADAEKTMYGFISQGETKKRTLDQDDINGISHLYPPPITIGLVGDFDGDGRTDLSEYNLGAGDWYIKYSGGGDPLLGFNMGWSETVPVPGDYDGDGTTDMAVYHQATGSWYVAYSGGGYLLGDTIDW